MIIDLKSGRGYIREPTIIAKYGQQSRLNIKDGNRQLYLDLIANK